MDSKYARDFINDNCIYRETRASKRLLRKGATLGSDNPRDYNTWLFNIRAALYDPKFMNAVCQHFSKTFHEEYQLAGLEHASTAIITSLVLEFKLPAFSIRKDQKKYGTRTWFEGRWNPSLPTVLIDDLVSAEQKTMIHGTQVLKAHGFDDPKMYCIINLEPNNKNVYSMFTLNDFDLPGMK